MIGECLRQAGIITEEDLQAALVEHKRSGERLGSVLIRMNLASERQISKALAYQLGFAYADLAEHPPDPAAVILIPKDVGPQAQLHRRSRRKESADGRDVRSAPVYARTGPGIPDRLPDQAGCRNAGGNHRRDSGVVSG